MESRRPNMTAQEGGQVKQVSITEVNQPEPSLSELSFRIVKPEELADLQEATANRIAKRAYELFEIRGCQDGDDLGDWFRAESELLEPIEIAARELENEVEVIVGWYSHAAEQLLIDLDSRRLIVTAKARDGLGHARAPFRAFQLPAEVDSEHVRAAVAKRHLYLALPKAATNGRCPAGRGME